MTNNFRSIAAKLASAALGAIALSAIVVSPAAASTYWWTGNVGTATIPQGVCRYYSAWNRLDMAIDPPAIYARNNTVGAGNDSQWVRYRVFVVNSSGAAVQSSPYSGFAVAYDNSPARFSGATLFNGVPNNSRIDFRIEWWNSSSQVGALAHRVDRYVIHNGQPWPVGTYDSCFAL